MGDLFIEILNNIRYGYCNISIEHLLQDVLEMKNLEILHRIKNGMFVHVEHE